MRGGAREGAGRKKSNRHTVNFWITDSEEKELRKFLESLRQKNDKSKQQSFEEILESNGQTTIFDTLTTEPQKNPRKHLSKKEINNTLLIWESNLHHNIIDALKASKKKAALVLAEALCDALNAKILDSSDELAIREIDCASDFIPMVIDTRKKIASSNNTIEDFMVSCGYILTFDEQHIRKLWCKSCLL